MDCNPTICILSFIFFLLTEHEFYTKFLISQMT